APPKAAVARGSGGAKASAWPHLPGRDAWLRAHAVLRAPAAGLGPLGRRRLPARAGAVGRGRARFLAGRDPQTGHGGAPVTRSNLLVSGRRALAWAAGLAVVGAVVFVLALAQSPKDALFAYLSAYTFALSTALGALVFLLITHVMHAKWPVIVRRMTES